MARFTLNAGWQLTHCAEGDLDGTPCKDPAFGFPAWWIDEVQREQAQVQGYTVVDPASVVATHLNHLITQHTGELFGRNEAQLLLDRLEKDMPRLVDGLIPGVISLTLFHKVLQNLLVEQVSIRDMRTIIDTMAEFAPTITDPDDLTAQIRSRLGRAITQHWFRNNKDIDVIGLDSNLEKILLQAIQNNSIIEPGIADSLIRQTEQAILEQNSRNIPPVLLVAPPLRTMLSRFLRRIYPQLVVLSTQEIAHDRMLHMSTCIGGQK